MDTVNTDTTTDTAPDRLYIGTSMTARQIVDAIDDWAKRVPSLSGEPRKLWHIMTALRGPDVDKEPDVLKSETTSIIRYLAMPNFAFKGGGFTRKATLDEVRKRAYDMPAFPDGINTQPGLAHFVVHARLAVDVLTEWESQDKKRAAATLQQKRAELDAQRLKLVAEIAELDRAVPVTQ